MMHPLLVAYLDALDAHYATLDARALTRVRAAEVAWLRAGSPRYADPPPNTVKVRIAVVTRANGDYNAAGWAVNGVTGSDPSDVAEEGLDSPDPIRLTWVTAFVPLPEPAGEVEGEIEKS